MTKGPLPRYVIDGLGIYDRDVGLNQGRIASATDLSGAEKICALLNHDDREGVETSTSIAEWADTIAGSVYTTIRMVERAQEELEELKDCVMLEDESNSISEEAADVVIVLCRIFRDANIDLWSAVEAKMKINRARTWERDGSGVAYHVDPDPDDDSKVPITGDEG